PAAAGRARPCARERAPGPPPRRAARRARPEAPQADAARAEGDPARVRDHVRPRHARPGGGDDDGRHDRGDERRPDRAARDARRAVRAAADRLRRRLPRRLEPAPRHGRRAGPRRARRRGRGPRPPGPARRPDGRGRRRRPAREDPARRRPGECDRRPRRGDRLRRRRDAVRRAHGERSGAGVRPEHAGSGSVRGAGRRGHALLQPGRRLRRPAQPGGGSPLSPLTRQQFVRRAAAGSAAVALPGAFAALARAGVDPSKVKGKTLVFSNWPLYIDVKNHRHPSLDQFTQKYGAKVKYVEDINDNASFFGKIQAQLRRGQSIGRDIIVMTDNSPYPALLVQNKWVEKLDKSVLPNLANLQDTQRHPAWDPNRDYSLPWQSGMTGIGYNAKFTKPITSVDQLFTDPKLKGKVTLLTEFADSLGLAMLSNG